MALNDDIVRVFRALHIESVNEGDRLGADLGIDSQELVSLVCELESQYPVPFGGHEVHQGMTVADVAALVARKLAARDVDQAAVATSATGSLVEDIVIHAPWSAVYERLHRVAAWPLLLPHVVSIDVIYDDGRYQEFNMTVRSADDSRLRVRSIRRCGDRDIRFFQPEPPPYLASHGGGWTFEPIGDAQCAVTTWHQWVLSDAAGAAFPDTGDDTTAARITRVLREHARLALTSWKAIVEEEVSHDPGTNSDRRAAAARV